MKHADANPKHQALYLHWGPGANALAERGLLSSESKSTFIDFWDQPQVTDYKNLIQKIKARVKETAVTHLVAHSFGARLAMDVISELETVESLTLLAPTFDPRVAFWNLAGFLGCNRASTSRRTAEETFGLVGTILQVPNWNACYWGSSPRSRGEKIRYEQFWSTSQQTAMDAGQFGLLLTDWISKNLDLTNEAPLNLNPLKQVTIHLGAEDPLLGDLTPFQALCRELFPKAQIKLHSQVGHFVPFEIPQSEWMESGTP